MKVGTSFTSPPHDDADILASAMLRPSVPAEPRNPRWRTRLSRGRRGEPPPEVTRVLSIDGGGIRGIMPAMILTELERRAGRPVAALFDLIVGTSTGGIIALALTRPAGDGAPAWRADQIVELYEHEGPHIFEAGTWHKIHGLAGMIHERYSATGLEGVLERFLGETRLAEALTDVLIPAYDVVERCPFYFDSAEARRDPAENYPMTVAARATSAAPTYFEPHQHTPSRRVFVDGGLYANNPAMCAFAQAQKEGRDRGELLLVSLGTGELTRSLPYQQIRDWGVAQWARPLLHLVLDGVSMATDDQLSKLLGPERYWRFQTVLTVAGDDLDDARPENIAKLKAQASELIRHRTAELDEVADRLSTGPLTGDRLG